MFAVTLALICSVLGLLYLFFTWNFKCWTKRGVAGPKPHLLKGNYPNNVKIHVVSDLDNIYRAYKHDEDFVGIFNFRTPQLFVTSPALCYRVFVHDFKHFHDNEMSTMISKEKDILLGVNPFVLTGEEWKERRTLITPGLTQNRIKTTYPVTNKVCRKMREYVEKQIRMAPKDGVDAKDLCLRFTSEVVTDCVLGLQAESFTDNPTPIVAMIKSIFEGTTYWLIYIMLTGFLPLIKTISKAKFLRADIEKFFIELMQTALDFRKSNPEQKDRIDFLNYMLQLQEKRNFSMEDLTANTMTFLIDGFETTAAALSHCLLLLGRYPKVQERLYEEIIANVDKNGVVEFEKLQDLPYLDACIHEALRIFPPALFSNKVCTEPIELSSKSGRTVKVEMGEVVILPTYSIMHDEDHYPNPEEFKPQRFLEENVKDYREKGLYYSFGAGPRICLGMRFALTQAKAGLVEIIRNFEVHVNPKTRKDNKLDPKYFLASLEGGVWLDFEARN